MSVEQTPPSLATDAAARRPGGHLARDPMLLAGREGRWRWPWVIGGTILILVSMVALTMALTLVIELASRQSDLKWDQLKLDPKQPVTFLVFLVGFLPMLLVPPLILALWHGVPWRRVLSGTGRFRLGHYVRGAAATLIAQATAMLIAFAWTPGQFALVPRGFDYLPWLVIGLAVIAVQALAEEVLFKGYLTRVWGAVVPLRWPLGLAMVALFASLHVANDDVAVDLRFNMLALIAEAAVWWALFFRTGSIAGPAGAHWMNNVMSFFGVATVPGQATDMALVVYRDPVTAAGGSNLTDPLSWLAFVLQMSLLVWLLYARRSPLYIAAVPVELPSTAPPSGQAASPTTM